MEQKKKSTLPYIVLVALGIMVIALIYNNIKWGGLGASVKSNPLDPSSVYYIGHEFVKAKLKAPAQAKFASSSQATVRRDGNVFTIYSFVDSPNSLGVMIRNKYMQVIEYLPNSDNYLQLELKFIE